LKRCLVLLSILLLSVALAFGEEAKGTQTVLILAFDDPTHSPGLGWIREAFPEVLGKCLSSQALFVISRDDRQYAFDRMGIPANLHASRATLYQIAGQLDAEFVIFGSYSYDGQKLTAHAQVLDMKALRLMPDQIESGPLNNLVAIQSALAWDLLRQMRPEFAEPRETFLKSAPGIRLDAFENYIRAVSTSAVPERIRYLKAATAIDPNYPEAEMLLGKTYFAQKEYPQAASWFAKVPSTDSAYSEANFLLGLCEYYQAHFERAYTAFSATAERVPLTEVLNNLGVVESRRGRHDAVEYFEKAVKADPADADYHFNLAVALYRKGDAAGAQRQLRETLSRRPGDSEARQLQDALTAQTATAGQTAQADAAPHSAPHNAPQPPLTRIKRNYDESSYRQLALELQNAIAQSIGKAKPGQRGALHLERAREFLASGAAGEAESQFRAALSDDPNNAEALAGLSRSLLLQNKFTQARREALLSLHYKAGAEAYLVLARISLHDGDSGGAAANLAKARELEPVSDEANAVEQEIQNRNGASTAH
jgi:tetratricopeptide (TPR) repeat protein